MASRDRTRLSGAKILGVLVLIGVFGYIIYKSLPKRHEHHPDTSWKPKDLRPLPDNLKDFLRAPVKLDSSEISFTLDDGEEVGIFYREALPAIGNAKGPPVVLLHGAGDNSLRWQELGTMHLVAAMGHRAIAVDLPGWGETKTESVSDPAAFLDSLLKELGAERPVIVTPSASGSYAMPYLMQPKPSSCHQRAAGLITVAPTSTDKYTPAQYYQCQIPAMLAFGAKDTGLGVHSVGDLRNMPYSEIIPVEGAGHAMMFEKPKKWHELVYNFLIALT